MQARSIEVAKKFDVEIHVRSTFSQVQGTIITSEDKYKSWRAKMEDVVVSAVTFDKNQVKLSILEIPDKPGIAAKIFVALAKSGINVDMIVQSTATENYNDISFTVSRTELKKALSILARVKRNLNAKGVIYEDDVAKLSIVGVGMRSHSGVAAKMFSALAKAGVNIEMISTSEIKISCIIKETEVKKSVLVLHKAFGLNKP
jgi:aspartate kinase